MSWKSAKNDARIRVSAMLERMAEFGGGRGDAVQLADYTEESFKMFCGMAAGGSGGGTWTFEYFQMVNNAAARELRKRGFKVFFTPITLGEFRDWLERKGRADSPQTRQQFLAQKLQMKFRCEKFDVNDQNLIEGARRTGQPPHIARAVAVAVAGFRARLENLPNGFPVIDGRPHLLMSAAARGNFFDHYVVTLTLQEIANATGKIVTVIYQGEKVATDRPASPDVEFL